MSSYTWLQDEFGLKPEGAAIYDWQYRMCGDFQTALWDAITRADEDNLDRLASGFPVEVRAYRLFSQINGWWPSVEQRVEEAKAKKGAAK